MRRCISCILPEICPRIAFDENGLCNVCKEFDEKWGRFNQKKTVRLQELKRVFDSLKNKEKKYDCLVPLSGGFDSTYILYICKRVYGLRTLAFNFNNGFQSKVALQNLENAVKALDVDLITYGPKWEIAKRLYSLFFLKTGEFCTPCNLGIWSMSHKIARDFGIPLIVSGSSDRISERLPKGGRIYGWSPSYFREVIRGEIPKKDVKEYLYLPNDFRNSMLTKDPRGFSSENIKILPLFDYIDYDIKSILETLRNELNWRPKADKFHHIDCIMEPVNTYFKQRKWGFSSVARYSMLVRTGQMTRDEALKITTEEEEKNNQEPPELKTWLELLNLSRENLEGFELRSQIPYLPSQER